MTYLLWQLFACVLGTAVLFLALGWFLHRRFWLKPSDSLVTSAERASWQTSLDGLKARLEAEAARRVAAEKALDDTQAQSAKISSLLDRHTAEIRNLAQELADKNSALEESAAWNANLQAEQTRVAAELAKNEAELAALRARIGELEPQLAGRDTKLLAINDELAILKQEWLQREGKFHSIVDENTVLKTQLAEYELKLNQVHQADGDLTKLRGRIAELEPQIAQRETQVHTWETRYASTVAEKDAELSKCRSRVAELDRQRSNPQTALPFLQIPAKAEHDNLKKIYGIGPVLEKRLNDLGVYFFREIAMWTTEDVLRYEEQLKEFRDRIQRDNWVEGAREEHFKKYGEGLFKANSAEA